MRLALYILRRVRLPVDDRRTRRLALSFDLRLLSIRQGRYAGRVGGGFCFHRHGARLQASASRRSGGWDAEKVMLLKAMVRRAAELLYNIIPFFQFLPEIRRVIYTTNAIESMNMVMRKYTRNRRIFPNDDAAIKAMFLAIQEASKNWKAIHHWKPALQSFQIMFGEERVPLSVL